MEILIKCNRPEVITDLSERLKSIIVINNLLNIETVRDIDTHYEKDLIIINLE